MIGGGESRRKMEQKKVKYINRSVASCMGVSHSETEGLLFSLGKEKNTMKTSGEGDFRLNK